MQDQPWNDTNVTYKSGDKEMHSHLWCGDPAMIPNARLEVGGDFIG